MQLERFVERWTSSHYPPEAVSQVDLEAVEHQMGVRLPQDYREAMLRMGLPRPTIALLNSIVDQDLNLHDVGDFYSPGEILEQTTNWREAGMPPQLIVFASDCGGNMFCFDGERLRDGKPDRDAVWFFDHDFGTVDKLAPSFEVWIARFCDVQPSLDSGPASVR